MTTPERGDIIVAQKRKSFPMDRMQEFKTVVERVEDDRVYCGVDGWVRKENIVSIGEKSPDYNEDAEEFRTTTVD